LGVRGVVGARWIRESGLEDAEYSSEFVTLRVWCVAFGVCCRDSVIKIVKKSKAWGTLGRAPNRGKRVTHVTRFFGVQIIRNSGVKKNTNCRIEQLGGGSG